MWNYLTYCATPEWTRICSSLSQAVTYVARLVGFLLQLPERFLLPAVAGWAELLNQPAAHRLAQGPQAGQAPPAQAALKGESYHHKFDRIYSGKGNRIKYWEDWIYIWHVVLILSTSAGRLWWRRRGTILCGSSTAGRRWTCRPVMACSTTTGSASLAVRPIKPTNNNHKQPTRHLKSQKIKLIHLQLSLSKLAISIRIEYNSDNYELTTETNSEVSWSWRAL